MGTLPIRVAPPGAPVHIQRPQAVHCDHVAEESYGNCGLYSLNCVVSISSKPDTFLDIRPLKTGCWERILLLRGDVLLFRGDVAHRGVEHKGSCTHYRIHCYCDLQHKQLSGRRNNKTQPIGCGFHPKTGPARLLIKVLRIFI